MLLSYDKNENEFHYFFSQLDKNLIDKKILVRFGVIFPLPDTKIWTESPRKVASLLTGTKLKIMLSMITQ